jgi:hypothetical protein
MIFFEFTYIFDQDFFIFPPSTMTSVVELEPKPEPQESQLLP